jgi:hypothetical protein
VVDVVDNLVVEVVVGIIVHSIDDVILSNEIFIFSIVVVKDVIYY